MYIQCGYNIYMHAKKHITIANTHFSFSMHFFASRSTQLKLALPKNVSLYACSLLARERFVMLATQLGKNISDTRTIHVSTS